MLYVFFGTDKISSGHVLIPNSPYFIGFFLCQNDQIDFPYKGRYFHAGGRFVCLGKPKPTTSRLRSKGTSTRIGHLVLPGLALALILPRPERAAGPQLLSRA